MIFLLFRCGILHARGIPPTATVTNNEVDEYIAGLNSLLIQTLTNKVHSYSGILRDKTTNHVDFQLVFVFNYLVSCSKTDQLPSPA